MNNNELSQKLNEQVGMEKEPVAIKVYDDAACAEAELTKYDGQARHCQLTFESSTEGKSFYATANEMNCPNGALALGFTDKQVDAFPQIPPIKQALGYAPLKDATFEPDVIIIYATPVQALKIAKLYKATFKKRFEANFNGTASLCADAVSSPYVSGQSNMTLGCTGSRKFSDIKDEEMVIGLTYADAVDMLQDK
ncbi:MAG: DUF169 domain-containing protein [Methanosphaera sp.]|nr:DUF169 domain-containing protein [Methanosphaera sp.]